MTLYLIDGTYRSMPVYGNTAGLRVRKVLFGVKDTRLLLARSDEQIRAFLEQLATRYVPADFLTEDWEVPSFGLTPRSKE